MLVILGLGLGCTGAGDANSGKPAATGEKPAAAKGKEKPVAEEKPTEPQASVSLESFGKIKTGMKYDEVVKILGKEGEVLSETEMSGLRTVMYKWDGDEGWGSNMNAMFQNGKLISKSQFGLK